jgi:hypothetical protein
MRKKILETILHNGMVCKKCHARMHYDYQLSNKYWKKIIDIMGKDCVLCAHCALESLGMDMWEIRPFGYEYLGEKE